MVAKKTVRVLELMPTPARQEFARIAVKLSPAGSVSVNAAPVRGNAFGLDNVKVSVVVPPRRIAGAPNALVIVGGVATCALATGEINSCKQIAVIANGISLESLDKNRRFMLKVPWLHLPKEHTDGSRMTIFYDRDCY